MDHESEFDLNYITAAEIEDHYGISKFKMSRIRDSIPGAIRIANQYIYKRSLAVPVLEKMQGDKRRRS